MIQRALCHLCKIENHKTIVYTVKGDIKIIQAQNACGMLHTRFQMVVNSVEGGRGEQGRDGATAVRLVFGLSGKLKMLRNLKMKGSWPYVTQALLWEDGLVATCRTGWEGRRPRLKPGCGAEKGNEGEDESDF